MISLLLKQWENVKISISDDECFFSCRGNLVVSPINKISIVYSKQNILKVQSYQKYIETIFTKLLKMRYHELFQM